jgi:formate/nitrite transporter FocA (FNT family)
MQPFGCLSSGRQDEVRWSASTYPPVSIGNMIGGAAVFAYAQMVSEIQNRRDC